MKPTLTLLLSLIKHRWKSMGLWMRTFTTAIQSTSTLHLLRTSRPRTPHSWKSMSPLLTKKQTEAITSSLSNKTPVEVAVSCQQTRESGISTNTVPDIDETQEDEPGALNENTVYHSDPNYFNTKTAKNITPQKNTTLLEVNVTIPNKKQTEAVTSSLTHKTPVEFLLIINKKEKEGRTQRLFQTMMKYKWMSMPLVMKITFAVMIRCMSMLHLLS